MARTVIPSRKTATPEQVREALFASIGAWALPAAVCIEDWPEDTLVKVVDATLGRLAQDDLTCSREAVFLALAKALSHVR